MSFNIDTFYSLVNSLTGLGNLGLDPIGSSGLDITYRLTQEELSRWYRQSWACKKICNYLPEMMGREWGMLSLEKENNKGLIEEATNWTIKNKLPQKYVQAQQLANKDGGAVVIRLIDDGLSPDEPVNEKTIKSVRFSRIYDRWEVSIDDPYQSDPYNPEYYSFALVDGKKIKVHKSRVARFRGAFISPSDMKINHGWEDSLLVSFLAPLGRYLEAISYAAIATKDFEVTVHAINGLFDKLDTPDGEKEIYKRLLLNDQLRSVIRSLAIDKEEEEYQIVGRTFSGVAEIIEKLKEEMIAASGLTRPQLIQEHPSGLAATGQSERLAEADAIKALQKNKWDDLIREDLRYYLLSKECSTKGVLPSEWGWEWNSLFQLTPEEKSAAQEANARSDVAYLASGILTCDEIRQSRFGHSSSEITLIEAKAPGAQETPVPEENIN